MKEKILKFLFEKEGGDSVASVCVDILMLYLILKAFIHFFVLYIV
jgi:hypothetical protein